MKNYQFFMLFIDFILDDRGLVGDPLVPPYFHFTRAIFFNLLPQEEVVIN